MQQQDTSQPINIIYTIYTVSHTHQCWDWPRSAIDNIMYTTHSISTHTSVLGLASISNRQHYVHYTQYIHTHQCWEWPRYHQNLMFIIYYSTVQEEIAIDRSVVLEEVYKNMTCCKSVSWAVTFLYTSSSTTLLSMAISS